jgi:ABC-type lipoprotein export system ATPase subunit/bifunctional DNA-binding transcriptional regulator/antitoxin component of YhaV-PrlF toxin-antitoxin module
MVVHSTDLCSICNSILRGIGYAFSFVGQDENLPGDQVGRDNLMATEPLIVCENLVKIYSLHQEGGASVEVQALQGLDITVSDGEMLGIVGASGSGKSTLLNVLGGLDRPTGGRAMVGRRNLGTLTESMLDEYRLNEVGFVWQHGTRNLIPYLTALENVELPLTLSGKVGRSSRARAVELLELVGLGERMDHRLDELSGGEQQRIAISIALANKPSLLLADEPTGELDTATAQTIYNLLRDLNKRLGLTMVIVSHDPGIAKHVDRVVAVRDGKLASETVRVQKDDGGEHHVELAVLDSAGRVQLPREYLEQFNINRRVLIETTEDGILIRRPDGEVHSGEQSSSMEEQIEIKEEAMRNSSKVSQAWAGVLSGIRKRLKK